MRELLHVDPRDATPLWRQIEEGVRRLVLSRALQAGAPLPSVRDLARDLRVNPATVAKAYQRLVDAGVLATRRGEGTYVAVGAPALPARERRQMLQEGALRFAAGAIAAGAEQDEAEEALGWAWKRLGKTRKEQP
jgi:GntR family transcriptional regulator